MGRKSRSKGKRGELDARDQIREHWAAPDCRRSQQYCGSESSADLLNALPGGHVEVKRIKAIAAMRYLEQADRDRAAGDFPIVVMREDRGGWVVMFKIEDSKRFSDALRINHEAAV